MKILFYSFFLVYFGSVTCNAQSDKYISPRSQAMGGVSACLIDVWNSNNNPASMLYLTGFEVGAGYQNRFLIPELSTQALAFVSPLGNGRFGSALSHFGNSTFHENNLTISYANRLGGWISAGINLTGYECNPGLNESSSLAVTGDWGILIIPSKRLFLGFLIKNCTKSEYTGELETKIPSTISIGLAYFEPSKFVIASQFEYMEYSRFRLSMGIEYQLVEALCLRLGMQMPQPSNITFGVGICVKRLKFDLGFSQHQVLGLSSSLSLTLKFGKNV